MTSKKSMQASKKNIKKAIEAHKKNSKHNGVDKDGDNKYSR